MEELLPTVYRRKATSSGNADKPIEIHDLALAFAVFACGAAGDLTQKPNNEEGRAYYTLARASMGLGAMRNSVTAIQALVLTSLYLRFSWSSDTLEESWMLLTIAMGMAKSVSSCTSTFMSIKILIRAARSVFVSRLQSILSNFANCSSDRDPGRWSLDPSVQERRRSVFWVIYLLDNYYVSLLETH